MEAFAPLDTIIPMFMDAGRNSSEHFGNVAAGFFTFTIWAAIAWAGIRIMAGAESLEGGSVQLVGWFLRIYILGVIGAFLLPTIIPALIEGAFSIGTGVSGGRLSAADFLMPTRLAVVGWTEVEKLLKHAMSRCNGMYSCITNGPVLVYYLIASLIVLASFVGMIIMVILSFVFFIMEGIGVLVNLGFMAGDKLAWIGRGGPATLVSRFTQMIIMSASLSIGTGLFELVRLSGEPTIAQAVVACVVALIIAIVAFKSEQIGASITGGMPGVQSGGMAGGMLGMAGGLLGAGAGAAANLGGKAAGAMMPGGGGGTPPTPPGRGGGGGGSNGASGTGQGHGSNPFGPSPGGGSAGGSSAPMGTSSSGSGNPLGSDINAMPASQASSTISNRARQLPQGGGDGAEAPTKQQWGDAKIMGTDIAGMTRSQAGAALDAHQAWFQSRGTGSDAASPAHTPASHSAGSTAASSATSSNVSAPAGWLAPGGSSSKAPPPSTKDGFASSPSASNPGERPLMRSAAGATARSVPAPSSGGTGHRWAPNEHRNDGRFQLSEQSLAGVGHGGGWGGTGYRGDTPEHISMKKTAAAALSGDGYWQRRDSSSMRAIHLGAAGRDPRSPRSAAASL